MTSPSFDMTESIAPRSDQQNYDDYIGGITHVVTVAEVRGGTAEQPVDIHLAEFPGRCYRPSKSMRRVLVMAWGPDASVYVGRKMLLYGDPAVKFGGATVGGIKIGALSHIDKPLKLRLTATRGKKDDHAVDVLKVDAPKPATKPEKPLAERIDSMLAAFEKIGITEAQIVAKLNAPITEWDADDVASMVAVYTSITRDGADAAGIFGASE